MWEGQCQGRLKRGEYDQNILYIGIKMSKVKLKITNNKRGKF